MTASAESWLKTLLVAALLWTAACSDATGPAHGPPARLQILSENLKGTVATELAAFARVHVTDERGRGVPAVSVSWMVVSGDGQITALAATTDSAGIASARWVLGTRVGEHMIEVQVAGLTAVQLTALAEPGAIDQIVLSSDSVVFNALGDTARVDARAVDRYGNVVATALEWLSSDATVALIDQGKITATGNGVASVSARVTAGGQTRAMLVRVTQQATSVRVLAFADTINALTHTRQLTLNATDRNGRPLSATPASWTSLEPGIAAVDASGMVRALAAGTARIRVLLDGVADTVRVHVRQRVAAVAVTPASAQLAVGKAMTLSATATDSAGTAIPGATFTWSSSAPNIATVNASGVVSATATGTASITARSTENTQLQATSSITVQPSAGLPITITPPVSNIAAGDSVQLTATSTLGGAHLWRTSASAVASVSNSGLVRGLATGTAVITAINVADTTVRASATVTVTAAVACTGSGALALQLPLGGHVRRLASESDALRCLSFDLARANGQQYLVMFENMTVTGDYDSALFAGALSSNTFTATVSMSGATVSPAMSQTDAVALPAGSARSWNFGAGEIYEADVHAPARGTSEPLLQRADGQLVALESAMAPAVGDTVIVYMEGIPRLGIADGNQRAVIRFISNELLIAEDVRLQTSLRRQNGQFNSPLSEQTLTAIAAEYAAYAKVQGDALFASRYNGSIEASFPHRVLAVHSLMMADNVWGYTYGFGNYFIFDYWVGTDGATAGISQLPQVVADNLFMHEVAHLRHWGLAERAGKIGERGNQWLVEGFARFSERLPIAARLLGTQTPSRTSNVVLPRNPALNGAYYRNDVPTFLTLWQSAFSGYDNSSYVFDYFADHVAAAGRDPLAALRDLAVSTGSQTSADAAVARWLPGTTFGELFTRARVALFADDNGATHSVPWTQYLQYQLRASRPAGSASAIDPVNLWPRLQPGTSFQQTRPLESGGAWGYLIDGTAATASTTIRIDATAVPNGIVSITRIR